MVVNDVSLAAVGVKHSQYPVDNLPEIAFAGKSNVGKSSLINCMLSRKSLARTSQNPGKTRTINFYSVEKKLYCVDLPGYGYAKASKQDVAQWGKMIESYLTKREQLKSIILLIDIRHKPGENDKLMYDWLKHYGYNIVIVATKADKIKRSQLEKHKKMIREGLNMLEEETIILFSSQQKMGRTELWDKILTLL